MITRSAPSTSLLRLALIAVLGVHLGLCLTAPHAPRAEGAPCPPAAAALHVPPTASGTSPEAVTPAQDGPHAHHDDCVDAMATPAPADVVVDRPAAVPAPLLPEPDAWIRRERRDACSRPSTGLAGSDLLNRICVTRT